jgi:hypothetical protein
MTPAEEARFIALWQAGTETAAIAQQLGIPVGTVSSRAYTLVRQGKLQPRPRGRRLSPPAGAGAWREPTRTRARTPPAGQYQTVDRAALARADRGGEDRGRG